MTDTSELNRADATRARLLDAAIAAFAEKGFHGTTTRDVAAAAGMSPAALYVHHRSKEELLYLISRSGHEDTLRLVQDAIASTDDPADALRTVIHDFAVHHARVHSSARIVNYELSALTPEHHAEIRDLRRRIETAVRELVERGVAEGAFHTPDPRMTAIALLSLGIDIARWYRDEGPLSPEDIAEHYAEMALRMVGARS
ncbi:TetR family transcriptional regulator [Pseudonocardia zijingensis]|jgi:AcrR family transcriptional regulator|uniref:TetR/AcrR family transcriptional regulator n=1 Tax=Pseudonocardia zijingensis TaxID=153376 RepID=A0ABN1QR18_9PSEU